MSFHLDLLQKQLLPFDATPARRERHKSPWIGAKIRIKNNHATKQMRDDSS